MFSEKKKKNHININSGKKQQQQKLYGHYATLVQNLWDNGDKKKLMFGVKEW